MSDGMRAVRVGRRAAVFFQGFEVDGHLKFGGAEKRLLRVLDELPGLGIRTSLILLTASDEWRARDDVARVLGSPDHALEIIIVRDQIEVLRTVVQQRFDTILYTDSYQAMFPFLIGGIIAQSERIMLHVTTFLAPGRYQSMQQRILFRIVRSLSTHIDVLYPEALERLQSRHPRKTVTLTPVPVGDATLRPSSAKLRTVVFLGSLSEVKGPQLLVQAVGLIQEDLRESGHRVVIAGSGPLREHLETEIRALGISDIVELAGQVDPSSLLPLADIFVSLQKYNNYPSQSLLEALASGCRILASDDGDTRLLVRPEFGVLVPRSSDAIALGLRDMLFQSSERATEANLASRAFFESLVASDSSAAHLKHLVDGS